MERSLIRLQTKSPNSYQIGTFFISGNEIEFILM